MRSVYSHMVGNGIGAGYLPSAWSGDGDRGGLADDIDALAYTGEYNLFYYPGVVHGNGDLPIDAASRTFETPSDPAGSVFPEEAAGESDLHPIAGLLPGEDPDGNSGYPWFGGDSAPGYAGDGDTDGGLYDIRFPYSGLRPYGGWLQDPYESPDPVACRADHAEAVVCRECIAPLDPGMPAPGTAPSHPMSLSGTSGGVCNAWLQMVDGSFIKCSFSLPYRTLQDSIGGQGSLECDVYDVVRPDSVHHAHFPFSADRPIRSLVSFHGIVSVFLFEGGVYVD